MIIQWNKSVKIFFTLLTIFTAGILITGPVSATQTNPQDDVQSAALPGQIAPRLQNLGDHKFSVTINSPRAQLFINQAMMLFYGFNHAEATRSFREAARLDPDCAMAYWGMALVLGPNINMAMPPEAEPQAYEMIQKDPKIILLDVRTQSEFQFVGYIAGAFNIPYWLMGSQFIEKGKEFAFAPDIRQKAPMSRYQFKKNPDFLTYTKKLAKPSDKVIAHS